MRYLYIIGLFIGAMTFISCNGNQKSSHKEKKTEIIDKSSKEYASKYICPMHCKGSGSDKMDICPTCGMDYELNEDVNKNAKGHDHNHDGHMHH